MYFIWGEGTLNFTEVDKKIVKDAYKMILLNLKFAAI